MRNQCLGSKSNSNHSHSFSNPGFTSQFYSNTHARYVIYTYTYRPLHIDCFDCSSKFSVCLNYIHCAKRTKLSWDRVKRFHFSIFVILGSLWNVTNALKYVRSTLSSFWNGRKIYCAIYCNDLLFFLNFVFTVNAFRYSKNNYNYGTAEKLQKNISENKTCNFYKNHVCNDLRYSLNLYIIITNSYILFYSF